MARSLIVLSVFAVLLVGCVGRIGIAGAHDGVTAWWTDAYAERRVVLATACKGIGPRRSGPSYQHFSCVFALETTVTARGVPVPVRIYKVFTAHVLSRTRYSSSYGRDLTKREYLRLLREYERAR